MKKFKEYSDFDLAKINSQILDVWKKENLFQESVLLQHIDVNLQFLYQDGGQHQDGEEVTLAQRDELLVVEHGTWRRSQKTTDQNL